MKETFYIISKEPLILITGIFSSLIISLLLLIFSFELVELNFQNLFSKILNSLPTIFISIALNTFLTSLIIRLTYEKKTGKMKIRRCIKKVLKQYFNAFFGFICYALICSIGFLAFIIPGIILMTKLFFYQTIIITEEKGIFYSFKKSWKITKVHWKRVLLLVLIYIIVWIFLRLIILKFFTFLFYLYFLISLLFIPFYFVFITLAFLKMRVV